MPKNGPPPMNPAARHRVNPAERGQAMMIKQPLFIVFRTDDGGVQTRVHQDPELEPRAYALLIADLVTHLGNALRIPKERVWEWIDQERANPTATPREVYRE